MPPPTPMHKKQYVSERVAAVTPEKAKKDKIIAKLLKGVPPYPAKTWSKEAIIAALITLENTRKANQFVNTILDKGLTHYKNHSGIYKLYNKWKKHQMVLGDVGRPSTMEVNEAKDTVETMLRDRSSDSSAFPIKDMKDAYINKQKKKAKADGLDPEIIKCTVSDHTAKVTMTAVAMGGSNNRRFTNKKLLKNREQVPV